MIDLFPELPGVEPFRFFTDFEIVKSGGKGKVERRLIKGIASTGVSDGDGENVIQGGLEIDYFLNRGWINYEHRRGDIIGVPLSGEVSKKGLAIEAELLGDDIPLATQVWRTSTALAKSSTGRRLGLSIEGKILERDGLTIRKARVYNVAVTPHPVNPEATFEAVVKSMMPCECEGDECQKHGLWKALEAGYANSPDTQTGGGALRPESLTGGKTTTYGQEFCAHLSGRARQLCEQISAMKSIPLEDAIVLVQLTKGYGRDVAESVVRHALDSRRAA